jgi:hypothetical protein
MERWAARRQARGNCGWGGWGTSASLVFPVIVMAIGALFLLQNLGILYIENIWRFWPVVLIGFGISQLISARGVHQAVVGLILGAVGTLFLLRSLDIIYVNVWQFIWPVLLIGWGLMMLGRHLDFRAGVTAAPGPGGPATSSADKLNVDVVFSGTERKIVSQDFRGGKIAAVFGGADIDLREAATTRQEIVINADAVFGGIDLWVPSTWRTDVRGSGVFGAYEDRTQAPLDPNAPKLIVKGGAVFGGVTVQN